MATNTLSPQPKNNPSTQDALDIAAHALLTAQIMAGSLNRLIERVIDDSGGDAAIYDDLNAALACTDKILLAASNGLQVTEELHPGRGAEK